MYAQNDYNSEDIRILKSLIGRLSDEEKAILKNEIVSEFGERVDALERKNDLIPFTFTLGGATVKECSLITIENGVESSSVITTFDTFPHKETYEQYPIASNHVLKFVFNISEIVRKMHEDIYSTFPKTCNDFIVVNAVHTVSASVHCKVVQPLYGRKSLGELTLFISVPATGSITHAFNLGAIDFTGLAI